MQPWLILATLVPLLALTATGQTTTESQPSVEEILDRLGIGSARKQQLLAGEILTGTIAESSERELAVTMAMSMPLPLDSLLRLGNAGELMRVNQHYLQVKDMGPTPTREDLAEVGFTEEEQGEVARLLGVQAGVDLNLSEDEIVRFQALGQRYGSERERATAGCREEVSHLYADVLWERLQAYREKGLPGIKPYARSEDGSQNAEPAVELRQALESHEYLQQVSPGFYQDFLRYPAGEQSRYQHSFIWIKQVIDERPSFQLVHRVTLESEGRALSIQRRFHTGHSINTIQILFGAIERDRRTLLFYANRTSTDQVLGFPAEAKKTIGRDLLEETIIECFKDIRKRAAQEAEKH